ncbi:PadR family transcriptional regulator [Dictyobacter aurantiacus]|uniref:PadR family transcriptional regulator n=1 Tax=Dictyobacter aurantiacus TaxID=1936993 RepID=A0A401ZC98_9CHLR|nr:PadR family transcriptional regulator [Dictyobacter aurantiacus]GCE04504.1 PadR family transcriptional regulator [Dictyobacter aurantiacus]
MEDNHIITTLGYALLALVARQASSGYDLAQRLKRPIGFFWSANPSHIYSELARLEKAGLITHQSIEQATRPTKKLFSLTESGQAALRDWVTTSVEPAPPHDELVLRAYAIWLADPDKAIQLFQRQKEYHKARLAEYRQILARIERTHEAGITVTMPEFGNYATLHAGIYSEQAALGWCHWMVDQFERHARQDPEQEK